MTAHKTPSSPPFAAIGACCASGSTRRDPWTGDERCQHCGLPVPLPNVAGAALHGAESPEVPACGPSLADLANAAQARLKDAALACCGEPADSPAWAEYRNAAEADRVAHERLRAAQNVPPPILGGQGRDASEVEADGNGIVWTIAIVWVLGAILVVGAWAAGGGR